jgi:hypothetical protein
MQGMIRPRDLTFEGTVEQGGGIHGGAHRVHRVATAAFWRTFSDEGKISPGW